MENVAVVLALERVLGQFDDFFAAHGVEWYIQSSLAACLHGVQRRNVTDIDIRISAPLESVRSDLKEALGLPLRVRGPVQFEYGEFRNDCLIIEVPEINTHIDVTSRIVTFRKDRQLEFDVPFDKTYRRTRIPGATGREFPVCTPEYLVVYKLVNQRGERERKNDLKEVCSLLPALFHRH